ncbi:DUF685 domain-containing protein [Borreliella tanukii]|uniref:DUF685 domain-containing protein n=1 Tax=Borreliella tanukii TaxID=56146 RepID=UPI0026486674|nr:DUF685 domain-containing protein [Borreliella tanukii]WKC79379.1 DUF685 domain-containing protein [Borreliella tanukii]WKC80297.1 DUF685 domain-containing protein [Borreliella tanukii]WKC81210.1 DUF685 domain-containing protein [Borreliella tanukii]WKC82125.1 DUF685 domain-containing protein [Borreliella tanukii]
MNTGEQQESVQIKDLNRKTKVNQSDLIPIDDIVEDTCAITYKHLLEQIQNDTFYNSEFQCFKKAIKDVISKELLENKEYIKTIYIKVISKLLELSTSPENIDFDTVFRKVKSTFISSLKHTNTKLPSNKISIYNSTTKDLELIQFEILIESLKEVLAEKSEINQLKSDLINYLQINNFTDTFLNSFKSIPKKSFDTKNEQLVSCYKNGIPQIVDTPIWWQGKPHGFGGQHTIIDDDAILEFQYKNKATTIVLKNKSSTSIVIDESHKENYIYLQIDAEIRHSSSIEDHNKQFYLQFAKSSAKILIASFSSENIPTLKTPIYNGWYFVGSGSVSRDQTMPILYKV